MTTIDAIPAVLLVAGNKTYGRTANGRLLYRAIPNDKSLGHVLVPYEEKINFCKAYKNKYILLRYVTAGVHGEIRGEIIETIGPVDILANCYRYELYCRGLVIPLATALKRPVLPHPVTPISTSTSTPHPFIFTIDGETTKDYDDAFSIEYNATTKETAVNIYIANVPLILAEMPPMLQALGTGNRMSTIYLPDKNIPMLPIKLSEEVCSLVASAAATPKKCFVLTIYVSQEGNILRHLYSLQCAAISRNYVYDSPALLSAHHYKQLVETTRNVFERAMLQSALLPQKTLYAQTFNFMAIPRDSADIVTYWMLMMNFICATDAVAASANAIYRVDGSVDKGVGAQLDPTTAPSSIIDYNIEAIIRRHCATTVTVGEYTTTVRPHNTLNVAHYMHITSPIRRLSDAVNMAALMISKGMVHDNAIKQQLCDFVAICTTPERIDFMNCQMQAIKKAQRTCELLAAVSDDNKRYMSGIIFRTNLDDIDWNIYLPALKLFTTIRVPPSLHLRQFDKVNCAMYMFHDEANFKRKVRVAIDMAASEHEVRAL